MYFLLFFFWEIIAFVFFFYSVPKVDFRGMFLFIAMLMFSGLAFASLNIEMAHVFLSSTNEPVTYTLSIYSIENAYLCAGMAIMSMVLGFVKALTLKDSNKGE